MVDFLQRFYIWNTVVLLGINEHHGQQDGQNTKE
jgi:hypothetical protein